VVQNLFFRAFVTPIILFQLSFGLTLLNCSASAANSNDPPLNAATSGLHSPVSPPPLSFPNFNNPVEDISSDTTQNIETDDAPENQDLSVDENIKQVKGVLDGTRSESALDQFDLLPQVVHQEINPNKVDIAALTLLDDHDRIVANSRSGEAFNHDSQKIKIAFQGKLLNEFNIPVKAATFFGKYLVFIKENTNDVSFIDLDYFRPALGRTALAVFRLPVETATPLSKLSLYDHVLYTNDIPITSNVFKFYGDAQEIAFNVATSLVDPEAIGATQTLGDNLQDYFNRSLELRSDQLEAEMYNARSSASALSKFSQGLSPQGRINRFANQPYINETALSIANNFRAQKKLMSRVAFLWAQMSIPRPLGAPKIVQALSLVASGLDPENKKRSLNFKEGLLQLANHRGVQMGAAIVTGAALGLIYPREMAQFFYGGLDITKTVMELAFGKARAIAILGEHAFHATMVGFNPMTFKKAYLSKEALGKLKWGIPAILTTLLISLGIPHLIVNTSKLVKELKTVNLDSYGRQEEGWYRAFSKFLVERENKAEQNYLENLSTGLAYAQGRSQRPEFTEEENAEALALVEDLRRKNRGPISEMIERIQGTRKTTEMQSKALPQIESLHEALSHFLFSTASLTNSAISYSIFWSHLVRVRILVWTPIQFAMLLIHPEMYNVAAKGHFSTDLNGGNRNIVESLYLRFFKKETFKEISQFEDKIIEVETAIYKASFEQTFKALVLYMDNSDDLKQLYNRGGIASLSDERLQKLSNEQKRFFRSYFTLLNEAAVTSYLRSSAAKNNIVLDPASDLSEAKNNLAPVVASMHFTEEEGAQYVREAATPSLFQSAVQEASKNIGIGPALEALKLKIINNLDPANNTAVRRNAVVERQLKNPQAVARSVRAMIASITVDKLFELFFTFVCLAGVTSGFMAPLQHDMFGPNSWFYLSKMLFTAGFVYDVISGVLAGTWVKLQNDEFHEGQFNNVPTGKDAQGSYARWFFKQSFQNNRNTLWQNHKNIIRVNMGNFKPALSMALAVGVLTMGRLDVDQYLMGYLLLYTVPLSSFFMKLEQGFELASSYFYKDIPENLRAHPYVQKYVNGEIGKRRLWFNFIEKFYTNTLGFMLWTFSQMATVEFGSRSLSRIIFAGFTPTELVVKSFEKAKDLTSLIPGANATLTWCENLLSKNYTDFRKFPRPPSVKVK